jgi:hypothetical protein
MTSQLKNVAGGATGRIGDPSGRNSERSLLPSETIAHNLAGLQQASIFLVRAFKLSKFRRVKNNRISFKDVRFYISTLPGHFKPSLRCVINAALPVPVTKKSLKLCKMLRFSNFYFPSRSSWDPDLILEDLVSVFWAKNYLISLMQIRIRYPGYKKSDPGYKKSDPGS